MENYKYLTDISGDYKDLGTYLHLIVFINEEDSSLLIKANSVNIDKNGQVDTKNNRIILNLGPLEFDLIKANYDKQIIKELIFNKYLDFFDDYLVFDNIY